MGPNLNIFNGVGLTIPSQRRYIRYFEELLRKYYRANHLEFVVDFMQFPEQTINRIIPMTKLALKMLRLGPMRSKMDIQFLIENLDYNIVASTKNQEYNPPAKFIESNFKMYPSMDELYQYELTLEEDDVILENDVNFIFKVNGMTFNVVFNLGFLQKYNLMELPQKFENDVEIIIPKVNETAKHVKLISEMDFPLLFQEFGLTDIDKLAKNPKKTSKFTKDFSIFIGFKAI